MRIGILGAGLMAGALGEQWAKAGHDLMIAGRTPSRADALARRIGARSGTLREAAGFGEIVRLAVRHEGVESTLREAGAEQGTLTGKTVIDCNNPVEVERFTLVTPPGTSLAEQIELTAVGSHVVKAFNLSMYVVWEMAPPRFDDRPLVVPICGENTEAKAQTADLIAALGAQPVDLGGRQFAGHLEAMAAVVISLLASGRDPYTVFNLVDAATQPAEVTA
jgi:8-hydroxy-5-deazaflavin:NADPH oxidoreductase